MCTIQIGAFFPIQIRMWSVPNWDLRLRLSHPVSVHLLSAEHSAAELTDIFFASEIYDLKIRSDAAMWRRRRISWGNEFEMCVYDYVIGDAWRLELTVQFCFVCVCVCVWLATMEYIIFECKLIHKRCGLQWFIKLVTAHRPKSVITIGPCFSTINAFPFQFSKRPEHNK